MPAADAANAADAVQVQIEHLPVDLAEAATLPVHSLDHHLHPWIARHLGVSTGQVQRYRIERRSLDARHKPRLTYLYHLVAELHRGSAVRERPGVRVYTPPPNQNDALHQLQKRSDAPKTALVVGTGPAGTMAAYLLALHGIAPLVLDRGFDVERRTADIGRFHATRSFDPASNYLYGEGGAGTYSDGKLYTRAKDRRMRFLLEAFVAARAPKHILWRHHPHVGSDILPHMQRRLRQQIERWGGSFRWGATVADVIVREGRCCGVVLTNGERIEAELTLIAPGHSARDLIMALAARGIDHKAKGYQLGCRIEHDQALIDHGQYGCVLPPHLLGAAEYHLVSRPAQAVRKPASDDYAPGEGAAGSVSTFCMCPGGEIICATSEERQLSTNGMSRYARNSPFANAGLIVNQPVDYQGDGLRAFDDIAAIERAAFAAGGGDYSCPAQAAMAFVRGDDGPALRATSYQLGARPGRLDRILPAATVRALREALLYFERVIPGFLRQGQLVGVETRVSSPVRFERNPDTLESSLPGLYLAGEGAGYAGGIVSAGLDGLRLAETIITGVAARRER